MTEDTKETETPVKKELSLSQFKSWLEGVEEMQEAEWFPNSSQWKTIRDKFDLIVEPKAPVALPAAVAVGPMPVQPPPPAYREREWHTPPPQPEHAISPAAQAIINGTKPQDVDSSKGEYDSTFG